MRFCETREEADAFVRTLDPRDVIAAFVDLNGLSSGMVMAGEQLAVPHQFDGAGR